LLCGEAPRRQPRRVSAYRAERPESATFLESPGDHATWRPSADEAPSPLPLGFLGRMFIFSRANAPSRLPIGDGKQNRLCPQSGPKQLFNALNFCGGCSLPRLPFVLTDAARRSRRFCHCTRARCAPRPASASKSVACNVNSFRLLAFGNDCLARGCSRVSGLDGQQHRQRRSLSVVARARPQFPPTQASPRGERSGLIENHHVPDCDAPSKWQVCP